MATSPLLGFWRKKRGLSPEWLARRAGITPEELANIESGKAEGGIGTLRALAAALGLTIDQLPP